MKHLATLNKYLLRYKWHLLLGIIFIIISNLFAIFPARIVRYAFDLVKESLDIYNLFKGFGIQPDLFSIFGKSIVVYAVVILIMALLKGIFLFFVRQTLIVMSRLIEYDLKNDIYAHYQVLPLAFYRQHNTGDLMARISEDVGRVRMYVGPAIMYGINLVVLFILVISYMLSVNVKLSMLVLLPLPFLSVAIYFVNTIIEKRSDLIQKKLSDLSTFVQEAFSGIRVIKSFARENDRVKNFKVESNIYKSRAMDMVKVDAIFQPLIVSLIGLSTLITVYVGGMQVMEGTLSAGTIAEFILYVYQLTWPVAALGWTTSMVQRASASQKRINEFLRIKTDIVSEKNIDKIIEGNIVFDKVKFVYPDSSIVAIQDISFKINSGQSLAILGTTGSGKSTIAAILSRMYDVTEGSINIDGIDIKDFSISSLRRQMGTVPQDVFLFSDTVKNNIAFGSINLSDQQIENAARDADVLENINNFPEKFETLIGERGVTLSGGQKQRISIARAIVREPSILVLDDALSAVDTKTENTILNNLKRIMIGRTTIIISHRVSSAKMADYIVVLDEGKIIQQGTHQQLLLEDGIYKELNEKQFEVENIL